MGADVEADTYADTDAEADAYVGTDAEMYTYADTDAGAATRSIMHTCTPFLRAFMLYFSLAEDSSRALVCVNAYRGEGTGDMTHQSIRVEDLHQERGLSVLSGKVSELSLPTLIHLLENETLTGWLMIDDRARIDFNRGRVTGATRMSLDGANALREILIQEGDVFEVFRGVPRSTSPVLQIASAVLDAYRLRDEWKSLADTILVAKPGSSLQPFGASLEQLAKALDGERTLREAVTMTNVAVSDCIDGLIQAKARSLLEVVERPRSRQLEPTPAANTTPPSCNSPHLSLVADPPADGLSDDESTFFDLLDRARSCKRSGDYEGAAQALRAALTLRPDDRIAKQNLRRILQMQG